MDLKTILPVIMTCPQEQETSKKSFASFKEKAQTNLPAPVVTIDTSNPDFPLTPEYQNVINAEVHPAAVRLHEKEEGMTNYLSAQEAAHWVLKNGLDYADDTIQSILFFEDDIQYSSKLIRRLEQLQFPDTTGFIALYTPDEEYHGVAKSPNQLYKIPIDRFYGTQAILFPKTVIQLLTQEKKQVYSYTAGYDIRWSRYLRDQGYSMYATYYSYVQHLSQGSRLHPQQQSNHTSRRFVH